MKRLLLLTLSLLCLTACISLPGKVQASGRAIPQVFHQESRFLTQDSGQTALWDAAREFIRETPALRSAYRAGAPCEFVSGHTHTLQILGLEKGEARLLLKIGQSRWYMVMEKSLFRDWEVSSFRPDRTSPTKTTVGS